MNRLDEMWRKLNGEGRTALIPFITAGDPDLATTGKLILTLERGGADVVELGVPFSDPMADGPVIQRASERALAKGTSLKKILALVHEVRKVSQVPILLMGYYNPILAYGPGAYARDAARAGVDATLVVDLPPEESVELDPELRRVGIDLVYLLTPTSDADRIGIVTRKGRGFIYFVSITGVTGGRVRSEKEIAGKIGEIRKKTSLPIVVGFGISEPAQARRIGRLADGVVVGSALVDLIHRAGKSGRLHRKVEAFASRMRAAL